MSTQRLSAAAASFAPCLVSTLALSPASTLSLPRRCYGQCQRHSLGPTILLREAGLHLRHCVLDVYGLQRTGKEVQTVPLVRQPVIQEVRAAGFTLQARVKIIMMALKVRRQHMDVCTRGALAQ
eukprot:1710534-Rhodomonas_salina.5